MAVVLMKKGSGIGESISPRCTKAPKWSGGLREVSCGGPIRLRCGADLLVIAEIKQSGDQRPVTRGFRGHRAYATNWVARIQKSLEMLVPCLLSFSKAVCQSALDLRKIYFLELKGNESGVNQ